MATLYNITKESRNEYWNRKSNSESMYKVYARYSELRKSLKTHLNESVEGQVQVYRKRRGEWGEWFEHWELSNGKPVIVEEGWM